MSVLRTFQGNTPSPMSGVNTYAACITYFALSYVCKETEESGLLHPCQDVQDYVQSQFLKSPRWPCKIPTQLYAVSMHTIGANRSRILTHRARRGFSAVLSLNYRSSSLYRILYEQFYSLSQLHANLPRLHAQWVPFMWSNLRHALRSNYKSFEFITLSKPTV